MSEQPSIDNNQRPLGVWALCALAVFAAGLLPIASTLILVSAENITIDLALSMLISLGVVFFAFKTWQGVEWGRRGFLICITLYYVTMGVNGLMTLLGGEVPAEQSTQVFGALLRGVFYPFLFIWYFNKPETRAWFSAEK